MKQLAANTVGAVAVIAVMNRIGIEMRITSIAASTVIVGVVQKVITGYKGPNQNAAQPVVAFGLPQPIEREYSTREYRHCG